MLKTKHSTKSYTNNKGNITHNEYNSKQFELSLYFDKRTKEFELSVEDKVLLYDKAVCRGRK
jgi:hypothetical protein